MSLFKIFNCCQRVNYIKNKEVDMNSNEQKDDFNELNNGYDKKGDEKDKSKLNNDNTGQKTNNIDSRNILLNQTNSESYNNNPLKNNLNNISGEKKNMSFNNMNFINLDKSPKLVNIPEDYSNFSNKVINNNIINNNIIKITNNNSFLNMNQKDIGYISFCAQSNINKSNINSIIKNSNVYLKPKYLLLTGNLFFNQELKITQNGLKNSLRNRTDFPVIFGTEAIVDKNGIPYNDFLINLTHKKKNKKDINEDNDNNNENANKNDNNKNDKDNDKKTKENKKAGRLFHILYDKNKNEYSLHFVHQSLILYYRINNLIYLDYDKEYYFILGNVFLTLIIKKINDKNSIYVKVETEDQQAEKANFENEKKLIIGREENCDIEIDKQCISKHHSYIELDQNLQQYYYKDNNSTNGSTLLLREDDYLTIKGSMYFKLENTSFVIKEAE